jgi:hypothetical protein
MSLRKLAPNLKCTASLLSYLLRVAQAPVEDQARARRGEISTRALARIVSTMGTRGTVRQHEAIAFERERAAFQLSKAVLSWFQDEEVSEKDQSQIIVEARLHLEEAQGCKTAFLEKKLVDVVHESKSSQIEAGRNRPATWFALRLALWAIRRMPDQQMCDKALALALADLLNS